MTHPLFPSSATTLVIAAPLTLMNTSQRVLRTQRHSGHSIQMISSTYAERKNLLMAAPYSIAYSTGFAPSRYPRVQTAIVHYLPLLHRMHIARLGSSLPDAIRTRNQFVCSRTSTIPSAMSVSSILSLTSLGSRAPQGSGLGTIYSIAFPKTRSACSSRSGQARQTPPRIPPRNRLRSPRYQKTGNTS